MPLEPERDIRYGLSWLAVAAGAVLLVYLLMIPPVVGVADNGDFIRVMGAAGIAYPDPQESYADRYFGYAHREFGYGGYTSGGYVSTHVVLVAIAGWIGRLFNSRVFDIRVLGACYSILMLAAVGLLVRHAPATRSRVLTGLVAGLLGAALLIVFGDIGYAAYFQSFFGEPFALVGMLLAVACAVALARSRQPSAWLFAGFIAAAIAVATSKIQNAPLGFAFAVLAWRMLALRADRFWHRRVLAGTGVLLLASVLMIAIAPDKLRHINLYQTIFFGILKDSPDVSGDMRELGIPERYAGLAGTNFFQKDTVIPQNDPALREDVLEKLGHRDIALFYLRHPGRFADKLAKGADHGVALRPYYLGNYDKREGRERGDLIFAFSGWSEWKRTHMPHTLGWFTGFFAGYLAILALWWKRMRSRAARLVAETFAVVALAGLFSWMVPLVGDGEADIGKHLFMFNVCFDMMILSALIGVVHAAAYGIASRRTARRGKGERGMTGEARQVHHD
ncbi:hypothetical protein [Cohnella sp. REN36]|uniref:glycan biosynthesis hexose transferase WsfD n=1 Tax=Cohnella sp. REN36 TaxID=2887347 RepID=UPI001D13B341|nr:hypothetical protein [Cohnella sp. REN36]MCC3377020.1 hypothetical protein [Cohnella sp. REN36]